MATEITFSDFKLANTFSEYCTYMNAAEQQAKLKRLVLKIYIGKYIGD